MRSFYSAGIGRLRVLTLNFLTADQLLELAHAKDTAEIAQRLESTWYGPDIEASASVYKPPELVEVALNRHLVEVNKIALESATLFGKEAIIAYLAKWDIENIELILAAKSLGRTLEQTEAFLVSTRNLPVGLSSSTIPLSDLRALIQLQDVEAVINSLVKYGYGAVLLQQLGDFRKSGDLGVFTGALQNVYYSKLLWQLRFLQGDEGVLREYFQAEISKKNILNFLKSREAKLDRDTFARHAIDGGLLDRAKLIDAYASPDLGEVMKLFEPWFDLTAAGSAYQAKGDISQFEVSIDKLVVSRYFPKFKSLPLSLCATFMFLFQAETERQNIRRITYAKQYKMTEEYIKSVILGV